MIITEIQRYMRKHDVFSAFLINLLIAIIPIGIVMLMNHGLFVLTNDFNQQEIPMNLIMNDAIRSGQTMWNWNIDLGADFTGSLAFYVLGSPFSWSAILFPKMWYPYLTGWILIFQISISGGCSYCYLKKFVSKEYALIGSIMYAFSGYQLINFVFGDFQNTVAVFPLLLCGVENIIGDEKHTGYKWALHHTVLTAAVALSAFFNYYLFTQEVLFIVIYYLCRMGRKLFREWRRFVDCLIQGIIGVMISCILFYPAFIYAMQNPRVEQLLPVDQWVDLSRRYFLMLFRSFMFPAEPMTGYSCIVADNWSSWSAYIPAVGIGITICFMLEKEKSWLRRMLYFLLPVVIIPGCNSLMSFGADSNYHRWYFMLVLIAVLATVMRLERRPQYLGRVYFVITVLMCAVSLGMVWWDRHRYKMIWRYRQYIILTLLGIAGTAVTFLIFRFIKKERYYKISWLRVVSVFAVLTAFVEIRIYQKDSGISSSGYYAEIEQYSKVKRQNSAYRFDSEQNELNMTAPLSGDGSFDSTVEGSVFEYMSAMGIKRGPFTVKGQDGADQLLSVKYYVVHTDGSEPKPENTADKLVQKIVSEKGDTLCVFERNNILPIGFTYDKYMLSSEFNKLNKNVRAEVMLDALVIPDSEESLVNGILKKCDTAEEAGIYKGKKITYSARRASEEWQCSTDGFSSVIKADRDGYAFFSVPWDTNWDAKVNGQHAYIIDTNGFMAVKVSSGENTISFRYHNPALLFGRIICFAGAVLYMVYLTVLACGHESCLLHSNIDTTSNKRRMRI